MLKLQLSEAKLSKSELADKLGVTANTVSSWSDNPPKYVTAYLELYIQNKIFKQHKLWLKKMLDL